MQASDFIGVYPDALPGSVCDHLVERFERSHHRVPGETGQGVDPQKKDSLDIGISGRKEWRSETRELANRTLRGLVPYFRSHPFLLAGATSLAVVDPATGTKTTIDHDAVRAAADPHIADMIRFSYRLGTINLQKYERGTGGYHQWHSEIAPKGNDATCEVLHRVLLWMYYLNDVAEGGETSFFFQERRVHPAKGTLVVAPAGFTHTHKGEVPRSGHKYIATSWLLFKRAQPSESLR